MNDLINYLLNTIRINDSINKQWMDDNMNDGLIDIRSGLLERTDCASRTVRMTDVENSQSFPPNTTRHTMAAISLLASDHVYRRTDGSLGRLDMPVVHIAHDESCV